MDGSGVLDDMIQEAEAREIQEDRITKLTESTGWKIAVIVINGAGAILLALTTIVLTTVYAQLSNLEHRVTTVESKQFTVADAQVVTQTLHEVQLTNLQDHALIRDTLSGIAASIPTENPPKWFDERVQLNTSAILALKTQFDDELVSKDWHLAKMRLWSAEFGRLNPDIPLPPIGGPLEDIPR